MQKTVLITGCAGQLGDRLSEDLSSHFNVISTYKKHHKKEKQLDIRKSSDCDYIFSVYDIDIIINCGALTDVDFCEKNKNLSRDVNVAGLSRLLSASKLDAKFIQISSDYVFDGNNGSYIESNPTYPVNYYGKSKLESENILIGSNRDYLIFRVGTLFDQFNDNFFTWVLNNFKNKKHMKVATDMLSSPTWVPAFSNVIAKSIFLDISGLFHYGSENPISRFNFATLIAEEFGAPKSLIEEVSSDEFNFSAKRPFDSSLDSSKISSYLDLDIYNIEYILKLINKAS